MFNTTMMALAAMEVKVAAARDGLPDMEKTMAKKAKKRSKRRFVTWYRHYLTGKIMRAADYGYKAWPFG